MYCVYPFSSSVPWPCRRSPQDSRADCGNAKRRPDGSRAVMGERPKGVTAMTCVGQVEGSEASVLTQPTKARPQGRLRTGEPPGKNRQRSVVGFRAPQRPTPSGGRSPVGKRPRRASRPPSDRRERGADQPRRQAPQGMPGPSPAISRSPSSSNSSSSIPCWRFCSWVRSTWCIQKLAKSCSCRSHEPEAWPPNNRQCLDCG